MPVAESIQAVEKMRREGCEDADVIAVALLEVASAIRFGLSTEYVDSRNGLELIGQMLGAWSGGGAEGLSIVGAINHTRNALSEVGDAIRDLAENVQPCGSE